MIGLAGATLFPLLPATPASADTRTWAIDANTLTTLNIQEDGFLSDGDEPYVAVIGYRSRFGVGGSTNAVFLGGLRELSSGADDGDVLGIRDAMGRANFPSVTRCSNEGFTHGTCSPEVIGTITVAMESDATPWSSMNSIFNDLATVVRQQVAGVVETTTLPNVIVHTEQFVDRLKGAIANIKDGASLSLWQELGVWLSSWSDPDDRIEARFTAFIAVDDQAGPFIDGVASQLPADVGTVGALRTRNFTTDFRDDDNTHYRVASRVS